MFNQNKDNARSNTGSEASSSQSSGPYISEEDWTNLDIEEEQYVPAVELEDVMEDSPMLRERLHLLGQVSRSHYSKRKLSHETTKNVDAMAAKLKKIVKVSRAYQESCKGLRFDLRV